VRKNSKRNLHARKQHFLFRPVRSTTGTAREMGLIVIQLEFNIAIEIPINADTEILRFSNHVIRVTINSLHPCKSKFHTRIPRNELREKFNFTEQICNWHFDAVLGFDNELEYCNASNNSISTAHNFQ